MSIIPLVNSYVVSSKSCTILFYDVMYCIMTMYLYCNIRMYIITHFCTLTPVIVLMLSVYAYGFCTLNIYVAVVSSYPWGRGVTRKKKGAF